MKIGLYIVLGFSCFLLQACISHNDKEISRMVQEWQGRTIVFPDDCVFTKNLTDTVDYRVSESSYKILVYVDSIGCVSCKLRLPIWKEFIKKIDSISDQKIPVIFFFHPKDYKEVRYMLKRYDFDLPICIDRDNKFYNLNLFPTNIMFQTFLLDSNNNVCIIGNPIHNLNVKDLYLKQIEDCVQDISTLNTMLRVENHEYNMGIVDKHSNKEITISLHNIGRYPFHIRGITTSCDCIEACYDWKTIPTNEKKLIKVTYKAEQTGYFYRTISIYGNIPEESVTLNFAGMVK